MVYKKFIEGVTSHRKGYLMSDYDDLLKEIEEHRDNLRGAKGKFQLSIDESRHLYGYALLFRINNNLERLAYALETYLERSIR